MCEVSRHAERNKLHSKRHQRRVNGTFNQCFHEVETFLLSDHKTQRIPAPVDDRSHAPLITAHRPQPDRITPRFVQNSRSCAR